MVVNLYHIMVFSLIFVIISFLVWIYNENAIKNNNKWGKKISETLMVIISLASFPIILVVYLGITDRIHVTKGDAYLKDVEVEQVVLENKDLTIKNSDGYKIKINLEKNELEVYHNDKKEDKITTKRYFISKEQLEAIKNKEEYIKTSYLFYNDGSLDNVYVEILKKEKDVKDVKVTKSEKDNDNSDDDSGSGSATDDLMLATVICTLLNWKDNKWIQ